MVKNFEGLGPIAHLPAARVDRDEAARVAHCSLKSCQEHKRCMYVHHPRGCGA